MNRYYLCTKMVHKINDNYGSNTGLYKRIQRKTSLRS